MELTPEERKRIYEEEKARIEAERAGPEPPGGTTTSLTPNVAGLLCYLGIWVSGIIFLVLEQKNQWVRFHAAQSVIVFGSLFVAGMVLGWIPFIGPVFYSAIIIVGVVLWIVLMVKAYNGERFKLAWAGDIAERMINPTGPIADYPPPARSPAHAEAPPATPAETPPAAPVEIPPPPAAEPFAEKRPSVSPQVRHAGRIAASAFIIVFNIVLLVFFNFFYEYVAYYQADMSGGGIVWTRQSFFTDEISLWLPVLTATLVVSIIGHALLIIFDKRLLRRLVFLVTDGLGLATVATLLAVFPFDFSIIPNDSAALGAHAGVTVALVVIAIGFSISLVVRLIKLLVDLGRGTVS